MLEARLRPTETLDLPSSQIFLAHSSPSKHLAPVDATQLRVLGSRQFSPARDDACSCRCNQKRLGQILGPRPGKQAHTARVLFLSLCPVSIPNSPPGNLGIHTVHCEPGDPPAATLFTLFSSASWLSLASPPRAPSRANSTPLFDLVTSSSSPHFPHPELILPATQRSPQHKTRQPPFPARCCAEEKEFG